MQTREEMVSELQRRLLAADNSTLYDSTRLIQLIKDAYIWASALFMWAELEEEVKTTGNGTDYYFDYPENYRTDTISELLVDDVPYRRVAFKDWKEYKRNNPTDTENLIFSDHGRYYFIFPTPADGSEIDVVGQEQADPLSADASTTIFSLSDESGNEAIVKKAFSVAIIRLDDALSQKEEKDAVGLLALIYDKQKKRQQTTQPLDAPMFDVPDFFNGRTTPEPGNFSRRA